MAKEFVEPEGQKVITPPPGAKAPNYSEEPNSASIGPAKIPPIEGDYCNSPKGQKVMG